MSAYTDLHWLAFMQKLAAADSVTVTLPGDDSGDYVIDGVRYHSIPPTDAEQKTLHQHAELFLRASRVATLVALRQQVDATSG